MNGLPTYYPLPVSRETLAANTGTQSDANYAFNYYDYYARLENLERVVNTQLSQTNAYLSQRITNLENQLIKQIERSNNIETRLFALETQMKEVLTLMKRKKR